MQYKTNNPVALTSQKWLLEALLELMQEKPYHQITIKDLTLRAQVDRSTFYRNFDTKEDILNQSIERIADEYIANLSVQQTLDMEKVSDIFFKLCHKHQHFFILIRRNHLSGYLLEAFNRKLIYINEITKGQFSYILSEKHVKYALAFNAGGMWNILNQWIDSGAAESPAELTEAFKEIIKFNTGDSTFK